MKFWNGSEQGGNPVPAGYFDGFKRTINVVPEAEKVKEFRTASQSENATLRDLDTGFGSGPDVVWNYFSLDEYVTPRKKRGLAWPMVRAFQRWNEVKRLMRCRVKAGQVGWRDAHGWMAVISNILSVTAEITGRDATSKNLEWFCGLMKMPPFEIAAYAFRNSDDVLISPRAAGIALGLTKEERAAEKIRTIDAEDELKRDRQRRLNREAAQRARQKKGAKPRSESNAAIARKMGISVSTLKRRIQRGEPVSS